MPSQAMASPRLPRDPTLTPLPLPIPQDIFGEMSVLVGHARSATVTTLTFVECVEIPKEALRTVLLSQPNVCHAQALNPYP